MSDDQISALDQHETSECYNDQERAICDFAEELTRTAHVEDSTRRTVKDFLSDREFVELSVTVGAANLVNRVNHALDVPLEE